MTKYINADKLKAEIERLKDEYTDIAIDSHYGTVNANHVVADLEQLLSVITSLQQEQPEVDLEREIIKYKVPFSDEREYLNETTLDAIARHFYELGKARKEE